MSRPRKRDKHLPAYVRIVHGSYQYRDKVLCRVEDGEAAMYEALAKRKKLSDLDRIPAAVAAFKIEYLRTLSQSSRKEHARLLNVFSDEFSDFNVQQVKAPHIAKSIDNLYAGKASAARHYKARISTFYRWCVRKGMVEVNPCSQVWVERPLRRKSPWTDTLFWAVRDLLSPMHQCYHDLSFLLYQRTTDVRRLARAQLQGDVIHFEPTKTARSSGAAVDVPITPAIRAVLDRAAAVSREWGIVCPFVIHTRQGAPFTRSGIHSAYRRVDARLHDKPLGLNPKALLPYAMTTAKRRGATIAQLQVARAHTSITTTEGYIQTHEVPVSEVKMELPERQNFGQPLAISVIKSDD